MGHEYCRFIFEGGHTPLVYKRNHCPPHCQMPQVVSDNLNIFQPIANIPFLSKVIESVVANQLQAYLDSRCLNPLQSRVRLQKGTEMALVELQDDLIREANGADVLCWISLISQLLLLLRQQGMLSGTLS